MDTAALKTAIKSKLVEAGAQNVFIVQPRMEDLSDIINSMQQSDNKYMQYWYMQRVRSRPETIDSMPGLIAQCVTRWYHTIFIILCVAYRGASVDVEDSMVHFDSVCDLILTALADERTYGNVAWSNTRPLELIDVTEVPIGGEILAHQGVFMVEMIDNQAVEHH